ncbi:hypothetical protein L1987_89401 [Smallanthus sonchifolius]|nr:hypothetical protein L1987_89401 [Smallanthus sonchifolius]
MVQSPLLLEEEDPSAIDELKSKGKPKSNKLQLFKHSRKLFWKREEFMPALLTLPLISEVDCGKEGHSVPLFTEERNENFFRVPGIQFIGSRRSIVVCNVDERGKRQFGVYADATPSMDKDKTASFTVSLEKRKSHIDFLSAYAKAFNSVEHIMRDVEGGWLLRYMHANGASWIGCQPVEAPFVTIGQISPFVFFLFFAITPILGRVGRGIPNSYTDETA